MFMLFLFISFFIPYSYLSLYYSLALCMPVITLVSL